ncbi:class I SAM-dependent methyltransferase [Bradyrhizobium sp. ARR65]|uniref:class I SAM-dependent methyltransferase n=1 Tax=Bradyrhizobium sp. ARR65 TaxID=1040989 RepID=UPI00055962AF|nr:class I SAM-dependent methyltransferase [Bradyrhizobium sp. ARR65]
MRESHWRSIKEIVRHVMHVAGLGRLYRLVKALRGNKTLHLLGNHDLESAFSNIYQLDVWRGHQGTSRSGPGSDLLAACEIIEPLKGLLVELECTCLVDIGCGDFNWMQQVVARGTFRYIGCDIVRSIVDANLARHQTERVTFRHLNACEEPIPFGDVIICREVLFHLSLADISRLIRNVKSSPAAYFIATLDTSTWFNSNIQSGDFRHINLLLKPFRFPIPLMAIPDFEGRTLAVWQVNQIPTIPSSLDPGPVKSTNAKRLHGDHKTARAEKRDGI